MTAVYLLRHPETTWNAEERYQGRLESVPSPRGKIQSKLVARAFAGASLDAVYSSPLQRSLYLAREVAQASDAPLLIDQRLTEMAQGPWESLFRHQIANLYPDLYEAWYAAPDTVSFPGGENLPAVQERALSALRDVCSACPNGNVVVVTHAVVVQVVAAAALGLSLAHIHGIQIHNASVTTLCTTDVPGRLLSLNVTEPLFHSPLASAAAQDCVS